MKKNLLITGFAIILVLVVAVFLFGFSKPPKDVSRAKITGNSIRLNEGFTESVVKISTEKSSFEFEGYGPGKSHVGTFDIYSAELYLDENIITGIKGTIDASSVNTGIGELDSHLKNEDFFDVEKYPTIEFESTNVNYENGEVAGILTFHGVSKEITFPVDLDDSSVSADFLLDTTPFNLKYTGINKEVRIAFSFSK